MKSISSLQNQVIKEILLLQDKSRSRRQSGKFVFEGLNELKLCLLAGFKVESVLFCPESIHYENIIESTGVSAELLIEVSSEIISKLAYREGVANVVVVAYSKQTDLNELSAFQNPLFLVAEGIEKPGNLGALLRTADAAGVSAVILADPLCDLYNPNVIRSSVGCVFTVPVFQADSLRTIQILQQLKVRVFTTFMTNATNMWECNFAGSSAIVVGTEHAGLSDVWKNEDFENINIPMFGKVDSLNVSVAAAAMVFEAVRQRNTK